MISCLTEGGSAEMDCLDPPEVKISKQKSEGLERNDQRDGRNNHAPPLMNHPAASEIKGSARKKRKHVPSRCEQTTRRETSASCNQLAVISGV